MLKAGMAKADITPEKGLELAGYPHYPRNNTGAHDPLYAACMYLENDSEAVAMVTLDLLFFSKKHTAEVRRRLEKEHILCGDHVMISCSHTHSGPWASGRLDIESLEAGKQQPKEYVETLIEKIVSIVKEAKASAFPAEFTAGIAVCGAESGVGGNRRLPGGPHDPYVSVMAVRDEEKTVRGIFVNYTLHPSFIHEWSEVCTADYPGYLKLQLEELEPNAITGFAQGASGNQSSRYYRKGESFDEAEVEEITKKFTNMRNSVRSGAEMSSVAEQYIDLVDYDDKVKFLRSDDTEYPSGMFEKISEIQTGSVQVFRYERGIYLIQKIDMKSSPSEYFDVYKNECLLSLKRDEMKKEINTIAQNQELVYNHKVTDKFA